MNTRSLKIELAGDIFRRKTYPKIRLQGHWLARLGFKPDTRVLVIPVTAGEVVLKVERPNE
jgi:hypothetical protein